MQNFVDFSQSFADFCGILQKNADNIFPQMFYDVKGTFNIFLNTLDRG